MKAPDKIWVREFVEGVNQMWSHIKATETSAIAQHEYLRKDALLEWAKEKRSVIQKRLKTQNKPVTPESEDVHLFYALGLVIDKINSL